MVYNQTKRSNDLGDAIQKVRHGNLNNSVMVVAGNRKYETALSRIETVGNFKVDYNKAALNVKTAIDKPKKAICEITPGFLKDNNLRIVYEALKVKKFKLFDPLFRSFAPPLSIEYIFYMFISDI